MKTLFLIRGLPGSGKSTLACMLDIPHCEADTYFYTLEGEYKFDTAKLPEAHKFCQDNVALLMESGEPWIVVANTFSRRWEMEPYVQMALDHDYQVTEITMSGPLHENIHGVPEEKIQLMRERWEK